MLTSVTAFGCVLLLLLQSLLPGEKRDIQIASNKLVASLVLYRRYKLYFLSSGGEKAKGKCRCCTVSRKQL